MNDAVLRAFYTMTPRERDRLSYDDPVTRAYIEKQIMLFPAFALPDPDHAVCIVGAVPLRGVAEIWMVTGEGFERQAKTVLRQGRALCGSIYQALNLYRMAMYCDADYPAAGRWARALGFEFETVLKRAGRNGCDAEVYLWPEKKEH